MKFKKRLVECLLLAKVPNHPTVSTLLWYSGKTFTIGKLGQSY